MSSADHPYSLGWSPELHQLAAERYGSKYAIVGTVDDRPLPEGFSLSRFCQWEFDQGQVGTCWENATTQWTQIHTAADGTYKAVALSRCMTGWQGKKLDGGGNPADGGSVTHGLAAQSDPPDGVGVCHEALWPYKPDRRYFAAGPPQGAVADASLNRVHQVAELDIGDGTPWKRQIFNGRPIAIGIWWPYGWDTAVDETGRCTGIGHGTYGHAILVIGWLDNWDGHTWWQIKNSHGPIYHPIPAEVAKRVPGYTSYSPTQSFDFWPRHDWLTTVLGYGNAEQVTAASVTGFTRNLRPANFEGTLWQPLWS